MMNNVKNRILLLFMISIFSFAWCNAEINQSSSNPKAIQNTAVTNTAQTTSIDKVEKRQQKIPPLFRNPTQK